MAGFAVLPAALAALAVFGNIQPGRDNDVRTPGVAVRLYNHANVAPEVLNRAQEAVTRIWRDARVPIEWLEADAPASAPRFTIHMLIRRKATGVTGNSHAMGTTLGDDHEQGGVAFVFLDRVLATAHDREQDASEVLAYAIVHEIGHLLLPYPAHSPAGIMRAAWDGDDLRHIASRSLSFTPQQIALIREKLAGCCHN